MVRNYKKKGSYKNYSPESIDAAVSAVQTNLMTLRGASKEFGISPTTLHNWVQTKVRSINFEMHFWPLKLSFFQAFFLSAQNFMEIPFLASVLLLLLYLQRKHVFYVSSFAR